MAAREIKSQNNFPFFLEIFNSITFAKQVESYSKYSVYVDIQKAKNKDYMLESEYELFFKQMYSLKVELNSLSEDQKDKLLFSLVPLYPSVITRFSAFISDYYFYLHESDRVTMSSVVRVTNFPQFFNNELCKRDVRNQFSRVDDLLYNDNSAFDYTLLINESKILLSITPIELKLKMIDELTNHAVSFKIMKKGEYKHNNGYKIDRTVRVIGNHIDQGRFVKVHKDKIEGKLDLIEEYCDWLEKQKRECKPTSTEKQKKGHPFIYYIGSDYKNIYTNNKERFLEYSRKESGVKLATILTALYELKILTREHKVTEICRALTKEFNKEVKNDTLSKYYPNRTLDRDKVDIEKTELKHIFGIK